MPVVHKLSPNLSPRNFISMNSGYGQQCFLSASLKVHVEEEINLLTKKTKPSGGVDAGKRIEGR